MKTYTHLRADERSLIAHYNSEGYGPSFLSKKIGCSKSTVSTEWLRNSNASFYNPETAFKRIYQVGSGRVVWIKIRLYKAMF